MKQKHLNKIFRPRNLVALLVVAVLVFGFLKWHHHSSPATATNPGIPAGTNKVNYGPPTSAEKSESTAAKQRDLQQSASSSQSTGVKSVTPIITSASEDGVRAYVPGIFEDGGTCTATATQGSQTVTKTSSGSANVSYTTCSTIAFNREDFPSTGTWSVVVSYSSSSASGSSKATTFEVK